MRHVAWLSLALALGGCGYQTWWNPPFSGGYDPNIPAGGTENIERSQGHAVEVQPLTTEPGDIWPGPLGAPPTLEDLEKTGGLTPSSEQPVPGSPQNRGSEAPEPSPNPSTGSSSSPGNAQPGLPPPVAAPPNTSYAAPPVAPPPRGQTGQVIQTPRGPGVTTGGTNNYQTLTTPGGGQSIVVPNGNGTSTVIHSDGRVETLPARP